MVKKEAQLTWIAIYGIVETIENGFKFIPPSTKKKVKSDSAIVKNNNFAIVKNNIQFSSGTVSFSVNLGSPDSRCQLILNHGQATEVFIGLNFGNSAYAIGNYKNNQYESVAIAGDSETLPIGIPIEVRIEVQGSSAKLFIDGIEVIRGTTIINSCQLAMFVSGSKLITISNFKAVPHKPKAFVVMQFSEDYDNLYNHVIRPTCEDFGFECIRADDIYNTGSILEDITRSIKEASVVIADVTPNNPNVFYEVGYSHGMDKPTILMCEKKREKLPFDVSGFRTIFYDNSIGGKSEVEERLRKHLSNISV